MLAHLKNAALAVPLQSTGYKKKNDSRIIGLWPVCFCFILSVFLLVSTLNRVNAQITVVQKYGQLRVSGNKIVDQSGTAIQLRGMSLYWSQWIPKYWTYNTIKWLRDDWKITVIRAAMGINGNTDGYLVNPTAEKNKVIAVVDAAIQLGVYVIIDWHDHSASDHRSQAQAFFAEMAQRYGNSPNVIYETWNEPINASWSGVIKPYHQALISTIRQYDADNIIVCGTRFYSQEVDEATADPLSGSNIAYTLHYYAGSHGAGLRSKAATALSRSKALFVTEYGTTDASGNGTVNVTSSNEWWDFLDQNKISSANWSVSDISESSSALVSGASPNGGWTTSQIKQSGQIVRTEIRANAPDLSSGGSAGIGNGKYSIIARNSSKVLDVASSSTLDGANIQQYTSNGGTNQQWTVTSLGAGTYSIRAVHSGKSMDLSGYSTADGADINQYTYSGAANQQWKIESVGSGYYRIVSVHSGKAVEITGASTANGAGINQRTYSGATNQQFTFQTVGSAKAASSSTIMENSVIAAGKVPQVYPNPSPGSFTIAGNGSFTYTVKKMDGKTVASGKADGSTSFGNNLPRGIYLLQVITAGGTKETKLVKE